MESNSGLDKLKIVLIIFAVSVGLLFLNVTPAGKGIRNLISYIYNPFSVPSYKAGLDSAEYFRLFTRVVEINNRNEELESEIIRMRADILSLSSITEENEQLKRLKILDYKDMKFKKVTMFVDEANAQQGYLLVGKKDGVKVGDIVQYGAVYAGTVNNLTEKTSTVRIPTSSASSIKVSIVKAFSWDRRSQNDIDKQIKESFKSNGVAIGKKGEVIIENIRSSAGVSDGDIIVVNDERIGRHLILGSINEINNDPALASSNARVSLLIDYNSINTFFIEIDD